MLPLTKEESKSHQDANERYICGKRILKKFAKHKDYRKGRDHCHYTGKYRGVVTISKKIKFIDRAKFMTTSLSNLVGNLAEGIHKIKCKNCDCFFE